MIFLHRNCQKVHLHEYGDEWQGKKEKPSCKLVLKNSSGKGYKKSINVRLKWTNFSLKTLGNKR